jgi:hypothetical protein
MLFAEALMRFHEVALMDISLSDPVTLAVGAAIIIVVMILAALAVYMYARSHPRDQTVRKAADEVKDAADLAEKAATRAKDAAEQAVQAATDAVQAANSWELSDEALKQSNKTMNQAIFALGRGALNQRLQEQDAANERIVKARQEVRDDARKVIAKAEDAIRLAKAAEKHAADAETHARTAKTKAKGRAIEAADKAEQAAHSAKDAATQARLSAEATKVHAEAVLQALPTNDAVKIEDEAASANTSGVHTIKNLDEVEEAAQKARGNAEDVLREDGK